MKQHIIIGNSAAGIAAAEAIRQRDKASKVLVFSDEDYPAYCRCLISYYLSGEVKEDKILYRPNNFYKENNIELFLNKKVSRIDPKNNRITCEDKSRFNYDTLLIATGGSPKFPQNLKGIGKNGIFGFRTLKDAKEIQGLLPLRKAACVLGGGLIGLKAAYGLKKRGADVKVVIKSKQVLSQMLDFEASGFVKKRLEENGIEIILGQDIAEITGNDDIKAVKLDSGAAFDSSLVIVAKGVQPNIDLIRDSGIKFNEGILADNLMRSNIPDIYTAGDACETLDLASGDFSINALWPVAVEEGRICGANMAGETLNYEGSLGMNSIDFFGLPVVSLGIYKVKDGDANFSELKSSDTKADLYKKVILKGDFIVGAIFVGDIKNSGVFLRLIKERINVSPFKDKLLKDDFGYPDIMDFVKDKEKIYV